MFQIDIFTKPGQNWPMSLDQLKLLSVSAKYHDAELCPLKPDQNGGDVLHRIGLQAIEWHLKTKDNPSLHNMARKQFKKQLVLHYHGSGNYCRYWQATSLGNWWTYPTTMSRDQMWPVVIGCALFNLQNELEAIYEGLKLRGGFFTNTTVNNKPGTQKIPDLATPQFWALLDKARGYKNSGSIKDGDRLEYLDSKLICARTSPPKIWLPWPWSKWSYPAGKPVLHSDPINKTVTLLYNKIRGGESSNAKRARQIYAAKGRVVESWLAYWIRPGDTQCPFDKFFLPYVAALGRDELI